MSHPMYPRLKDFVENVSNGSIAINRLIPVQSSMGDQIFQVPFPQYCDKMAEMERVPKLTIYRLVQDAINKGFLQRMNRSDVFQKGVEGACNRVESGVSAPSLFEDTVQRPFLTSYYDTERDKMNELLSMISEIEREVESGKGDRG